jgi:phage N-6-adenine-methyltransferase
MEAHILPGLAAHPAADIFPLLDGPELDDLAEDIRAHGLREPVVMLGGLVLDGRNRLAACRLAGVEPRFAEWTGEGDPLDWVVSMNLKRRHLSTSQRAMVAARTLDYHRERAKERQEEGQRAGREARWSGDGSAQICAQPPLLFAGPPDPMVEAIFDPDRPPLLPPPEPPRKATADAARTLNVSPRSVEHAAKVLDEGAPELVRAVETGAVAVSAAEVLTELPRETQAEIVAQGPEAVREAVREIHNHRAQGTGENEWYTPGQYIEAARSLMGGIDLDPASSDLAQRTVGADAYFTKADDGLAREWAGRVWLNPPYAQPAIQHFADKVVAEVRAGRVTEAVVLTHNYTDTAWFHNMAADCSAICFTRGRIGFVAPDGKRAAPTQGQAFFYFGPRPEAFAEAFGAFGFVMVRA